jgi:hypothetical protein
VIAPSGWNAAGSEALHAQGSEAKRCAEGPIDALSEAMTPQPVFIAETFARFDAPWTPRRVGRVDGHDVNPVRLQGAFHGYVHAGAGEMFRVGGGVLRMQFRKCHEDAGQGAFIIIPGGMATNPRHRTANAW